MGSSPHVRGTLSPPVCKSPQRGIIPACAGNTMCRLLPVPSAWDHPRMCGEHVLQCFVDPLDEGSSPHVRGTRSPKRSPWADAGIIPACAGNTSSGIPETGQRRNHPRMCGEHVMLVVEPLSLAGSSPHVRGTLQNNLTNQNRIGIIPACAGNTFLFFPHCSSTGDHPRMCGEHFFGVAQRRRRVGSSPHVRGTRYRRGRAQLSNGIIPACAGNTSHHFCVHIRVWDHPRMCGEHACTRGRWAGLWGSSPHVRGTPFTLFKPFRRPGIIPACAGNTGGVDATVCDGRDHPRMCGEHLFDVYLLLDYLGSSPHVRGTLQPQRVRRLIFGIIPACAGNTDCPQRIRRLHWDHPRMCGEHARVICSNTNPPGSSPHVRGTLVFLMSFRLKTGIIPACAGNTCRPCRAPWQNRDHPRMCGEHTLRHDLGDELKGSSPHVRGTPVGR